MSDGLIHVYTGDGKGKTTASVGLAVRAAGAGKNVLYLQLFKGKLCNEFNILNTIDNIKVKRLTTEKFSWEMNEEELKQYGKKACEFFLSNLIKTDYDMIIIDEIFSLIELNLISQTDFCKIIESKNKATELVLTGRNAPYSIIKYADYVSNICCIKHPFTKGVAARNGIEF